LLLLDFAFGNLVEYFLWCHWWWFERDGDV